jgi:hypothetical protein
MGKTNVILSLVLVALPLILCSCASVKTSIELRPELTNDDTEVWEIYGVGNKSASYEDVRNAVKEEAAKKSNSEGKDCFLMLTREDQTLYFSETRTGVATMHGQSNNSTNYYSNRGGYLGNSQGSGNYSYQVPVTQTNNYSKATTSWYVLFGEESECERLENSKWRERIWYNDEVIERMKSKRKSSTIIWGSIITLVLIIAVLDGGENSY